MSAVTFASAGYVSPPPTPCDTTVIVQEQIAGSIEGQENLAGSIIEDCAAPSFDVLTFAFDDPSDVEIGTVVATPSFSATYNQVPTSADLDDSEGNPTKDVIATPNAFSSDFSFQKTTPNASVTATLTADAGGPADSNVATKTWRARQFIGWTTNAGPYTEADILALNELSNGLSSTATFSDTLSPTNGGAGAYLVHAYETSFGPRTPLEYEIGSLGPGDVTEVQTGLSMAIPGGTMTVRVARSDNLIEAPGGVSFEGT